MPLSCHKNNFITEAIAIVLEVSENVQGSGIQGCEKNLAPSFPPHQCCLQLTLPNFCALVPSFL